MSLLYSPAPSGGRRPFIAIPSYSNISNLTAFCLYRSDVNADLCILTGNCHVDDSRNILVKEFLKTDCDQLIFIDADIGFQPSDLKRLAELDYPVIGASYPRKEDNEDFPCLYIPGEIWSNADGVIEVIGIPTGFMKIQRPVLETLYSEARKYKVKGPGDNEEAAEIFERGIVNGGRISGDYNFCRKWRNHGKVYVDPEIYIEHVGEKKWEGSLASHLRRKNGLSMSRVLDRLKSGKESDSDIIEIWQDWGNPQWSASVEMLKTCIHLSRQVTTIDDLGSGLTSIVMAAANPEAEIIAYDHDEVWASKVRGVSEKHGLSNLSVQTKNLTDYSEGKWYADMDLNGEMVVCDGPPRNLSNRHILFDYLKSPKCVVMDDTPVIPDQVSGEAEIKGQHKKFMVWQPPKTLLTTR